MDRADTDRLRSIKTLPSLIKYLRDELDWPIESDDAEDMTFDFSPEELGIDTDNAVKIKEIKQVRPLTTNQPWGIFWVNFEPKRLPVVVLRRILSGLAIKKRASAQKARQRAWSLNDLLFISSYGESGERAVTFAHFSQSPDTDDLPTLRVLGWDDQDTVLHLDHAHATLRDKFRWRSQFENDADAWRKEWSSAFVLRHREVITTSQDLASRLAELATRIRKRANLVLRIESERGALRKLHKAFQEALIHDLTEDDFADMYAQTITYGLLAAAISRTEPGAGTAVVADNLSDMVPVTNPFLRDMLSTFLSVGGRKGKIDFDELGIQEVVDVLNSPDTHMEAVLRDFGNRTRQEDPVIHFYELFLSEYDREKKVERGVFYTPQAVVSCIVRSVHELLQREFGLEDGLASTVSWGEMARRTKGQKSEVKIPKGVSSDEPFVQILDPATGTATFLVEVIEVICQAMTEKWKREGKTDLECQKQWNEYVPKHLLPRIYGFELMMAPYAISHLKIGLKLYETKYRFKSDQRVNVYLTNSLEPPQDFSDRLAFDAPALAHEAQAVNKIKRHKCFTVVIGNPPYSIASANQGEWIAELCEVFKETVRTRERQIQALSDDYVKFIRFASWCLERSAYGIVGMITNNGYLDGHLFVDLRRYFNQQCSSAWLLNLRGNTRTREKAPDGAENENVFDIQTGVAVGLFVEGLSRDDRKCRLYYRDVWGSRSQKYSQLSGMSLSTAKWTELKPPDEEAVWLNMEGGASQEWQTYTSLLDIFGTGDREVDPQKRYAAGFVTQQDDFAIAFTKTEMKKRLGLLLEKGMTEAKLREQFRLCTTSQWNFARSRKELGSEDVDSLLAPCTYRPFDTRWTIFHRGVVSILRKELMRHLFRKTNVALLATRGVSRQYFAHTMVTSQIVDRHAVDNASESVFVFPLYIYPSASVEDAYQLELVPDEAPVPNINARFLKAIAGVVDSRKQDAPEQVLHYIYAVLHSKRYRDKYAEFLKIDFPRVPLTRSPEFFHSLAELGQDLVSLHLLDSRKVDRHITKWIGDAPSGEVGRIEYTDKTVWIDEDRSEGFRGVPEAVWVFLVGGYQVCEKWLKDRKGRRLSKDDIEHYQKIVVALSETIRLMAEIDKVIDAHGGWPKAFQA